MPMLLKALSRGPLASLTTADNDALLVSGSSFNGCYVRSLRHARFSCARTAFLPARRTRFGLQQEHPNLIPANAFGEREFFIMGAVFVMPLSYHV